MNIYKKYIILVCAFSFFSHVNCSNDGEPSDFFKRLQDVQGEIAQTAHNLHHDLTQGVSSNAQEPSRVSQEPNRFVEIVKHILFSAAVNFAVQKTMSAMEAGWGRLFKATQEPVVVHHKYIDDHQVGTVINPQDKVAKDEPELKCNRINNNGGLFYSSLWDIYNPVRLWGKALKSVHKVVTFVPLLPCDTPCKLNGSKQNVLKTIDSYYDSEQQSIINAFMQKQHELKTLEKSIYNKKQQVRENEQVQNSFVMKLLFPGISTNDVLENSSRELVKLQQDYNNAQKNFTEHQEDLDRSLSNLDIARKKDLRELRIAALEKANPQAFKQKTVSNNRVQRSVISGQSQVDAASGKKKQDNSLLSQEDKLYLRYADLDDQARRNGVSLHKYIALESPFYKKVMPKLKETLRDRSKVKLKEPNQQ